MRTWIFWMGMWRMEGLRDWMLPVEAVHRRWYYDGKAH